MATKSRALDQWADYFRTANSDIFEIIEHAIIVAASDSPEEFKIRRDQIAELLFSCKLTRCTGCERVVLRVPEEDDVENGRFASQFDGNRCEFDADGSKESKANSCRDDQTELNVNQVSNYSYGEAEILTDAIEEENQTVEEVLRIKQLLQNFEAETDFVLFDSLRKLQLMALNVDILKATEIGKAVNYLRRHGSKQIRRIARNLIEGWKVIVDEWVKTTEVIVEGTPDSVDPSVLDVEEGLPSPPLDEGAFFATQNIELSQFFDGMDDDGNPQNSREFDKNQGGGRKPITVKKDVISKPKEPLPKERMVISDNNRDHQMKKDVVPKPFKASNTQSGPGRPLKHNGLQKVGNDANAQQKLDKPNNLKRPSPLAEKVRCPNEDSVQLKLEASKRKLQERYQQAEDVKRQRTVQVMDLHDLPKQGLGHKNAQRKFGNHNRPWANGRR